MNIEDKKTFIRLVQTGASMKAFRGCGVGPHNMAGHLAKLAQYEKDVAEHEKPKVVEAKTLLNDIPEKELKKIKKEVKAFETRKSDTLTGQADEQCCEDPTNCPPECDEEEGCDDA